MNMIAIDTTPDAARKQVEILRRVGISGRGAMTFELSENLRRIVEAGVRHRHLDWDDQAVHLGVARLTLDERLFGEAFPNAEEPK